MLKPAAGDWTHDDLALSRERRENHFE